MARTQKKFTAYPKNAHRLSWYNLQRIPSRNFKCGFCDNKVASENGFSLVFGEEGHYRSAGGVYICPECLAPTSFTAFNDQFPVAAFGNSVSDVPEGLHSLYQEARRCTAEMCYTAAVLLCRKMLMNIAVEEGAKEGLKFGAYVQFLFDNHHVPPSSKTWVDRIRTKANEATHEIAPMSCDDAHDLISFVEMLLKLIYEYPKRAERPTDSKGVSK